MSDIIISTEHIGAPFVVANPAAAHGNVRKQWDEIYAQLASVFGDFDHAFTSAPGEASAIVRAAIKAGHKAICSLGGDGTHNEVVNGFFEEGEVIDPEAALGILPFGTGGDFRRTLGLSGDLIEAAVKIKAHKPTPCDVGHLTYINHEDQEAEIFFLNITSFGIGGLVNKKVNSGSKALGGPLSFMIGTAKALVEYSPTRVHITVDDGEELDVMIMTVAVANGQYFGGGMKIAPHARLDDGLFDIVIMRPAELREYPQLYKLYLGRHFESNTVSHMMGTRVHARPHNESDIVLIDLDGEQPGKLPATLTILPNAIRLFDQG